MCFTPRRGNVSYLFSGGHGKDGSGVEKGERFRAVDGKLDKVFHPGFFRLAREPLRNHGDISLKRSFDCRVGRPRVHPPGIKERR